MQPKPQIDSSRETESVPLSESSSERVYLAIAKIGNCKVCNKEDDLRFGACFDCADHVAGEQLSPTTHRLWDRRNPSNEWFASETGDA